MTATNTTFNKVAVLEDLMRQEPHNAAHYKEVQRVQKNQHIQVAVKLQHMLEADDEFRQTAGLPQLDLPEHLWMVRNMDTAPVREQHFMAISSEVEVLCQQLKVKGMYPCHLTICKLTSKTYTFSPFNRQNCLHCNHRTGCFSIHCLARRQGQPDRNQTVLITLHRIVAVRPLRCTHHPRVYQNQPFANTICKPGSCRTAYEDAVTFSATYEHDHSCATT